MEFPLWALFALLCAASSALVLLIPEKVKCDGFALAYWNKVAALVYMIPAVLYWGVPEQWEFYALVATLACFWVISDVIFFRALPEAGAGVISRILPASVILTFVFWFFFDPALLQDYLSKPVLSAMVCIALLGSVYFATRLKHDPVSWRAVRIIWFVLFAATIAPIIYKLITQQTKIEEAVPAYIFFEAFVMVAIWSVYYAVKRPVAKEILFSKNSLRAGAIVGLAMCLVTISKFLAIHQADNPGLVPAVKYLDAIIVIAYYRAVGRTETVDVLAGLGIVGCAVIIIFAKSFAG